MTNSINVAGDTHTVAKWIWQNLVPNSGQAATVQGELLRAVEKLSWEAQNNGNINWDDRFQMFLDFLANTLLAEKRLPPNVVAGVQSDLDRLARYHEPYCEDDLYDRLTEAVVAYCRLNPAVVPKAIDPQQYR